MTYFQTLIDARNAKRMTQEQVAHGAGISRTQYVAMEGGVIPTPTRWRPVLAVLDVTEEAYLGEMTTDQREKAVNEKRRGRRNPKPQNALGSVGFLRDPSAGVSKEKVLGIMPDDSMEPVFMQGDEVRIETLEPARLGDIVAIQGPGIDCLVRRLVRIDETRDEAVVEDMKTRTMTRIPIIEHEYDDKTGVFTAGTTIYRVV
jgi:transcriptional regulator with XRE-family HTH domain